MPAELTPPTQVNIAFSLIASSGSQITSQPPTGAQQGLPPPSSPVGWNNPGSPFTATRNRTAFSVPWHRPSQGHGIPALPHRVQLWRPQSHGTGQMQNANHGAAGTVICLSLLRRFKLHWQKHLVNQSLCGQSPTMNASFTKIGDSKEYINNFKQDDHNVAFAKFCLSCPITPTLSGP